MGTHQSIASKLPCYWKVPTAEQVKNLDMRQASSVL